MAVLFCVSCGDSGDGELDVTGEVAREGVWDSSPRRCNARQYGRVARTGDGSSRENDVTADQSALGATLSAVITVGSKGSIPVIRNAVQMDAGVNACS